MAFGDPLQWVIIGVIVIAVFLWGPQKIPEIARGVGRARREFENASKEGAEPAAAAATTTGAADSGDQLLFETAKKLGITTEGKTREQISAEIVSNANKKS